jgi:hypothetical protein
MNSGIRATFAEWRFLLLTLLICTFLMTAPLIGGNWQIQILLEVLLLVAVLVTVSANPGWHKFGGAVGGVRDGHPAVRLLSPARPLAVVPHG